MDGTKTRNLPVPHVAPTAENILTMLAAAADKHGLPVKAVIGDHCSKTTAHRIFAGDAGNVSANTFLAFYRALPPEFRVAFLRQMESDEELEISVRPQDVQPASTPLDGAISATVRAAEVLAAFRLAVADGVISISEAVELTGMLDRFEREIECTRAALAASQRRTLLPPLAIARTTAPAGP